MQISTLKQFTAILLTAFALSFAGCVTDVYEPKPGPDPDPTTPTPKPEGPIFDFSTEKNYTLNVNYDVPEGYKVYFEVFTENPRTVDEDGQYVMRNIKPIDVGFTDVNGAYSHRIKVPTTVKKLYVYTSYAGVPHLLVADVTGDVLQAKEVEEEFLETKSMVLRATDDYKNADYNKFANGFSLKRLGYWINQKGYMIEGASYSVYGRPDYLLSNKISISANVLNGINQTVPEGRLRPDIDKYIMNGDIHVIEVDGKKSANVDVHFIDATTSARSIFGYYCYKTNNPPTKVSDIEKNITVLFPNAKRVGDSGGLMRGEGVRLHYMEDGIDKGIEFPVGTSIGWVIYNNAYVSAYGGKPVTKGENEGPFYSTPALNGGSKKYVALFRVDDFVVMGMDDWSSGTDYNDVEFNVHANPIDAITGEIPDVKPEEPKPVAGVSASGTLAFEDLWPNQGDFDLNDVVVKYDSKITYNDNNEVTETVDEYTLLWSGASIHNGFAYQLDNVKRGDVEISFSGEGAGSASIEQGLALTTVYLFQDALVETANNTKTSTVTVTTRYRNMPKDQFEMAPYNPFITTSSRAKEVHLTNRVPTRLAEQKWFGSSDDLSVYGQGIYYITFVGTQQMPFAINIPSNPDPEKDIPFVIPREGKRIDNYYPRFINWINTKGEQDSDWYLHPSDEKPSEPVVPEK